ncbi:hypothetical protein [Thermoflexus sp.]|uniref:hypothetical protein n=1 Tax=Thermoflexus sp. TaxID=1969742 RepID=UPI002ADDE747|nr:hypothetical protein [Thermoflexus sp.]
MKTEPSLDLVSLIAEAIRPDGGWVAIGERLEGSRVVIARLGQTVWIRELPPDLATARFLEWGNLRLNGDGEPAPTLRLVVHDPQRFRIPPREVLRRIGFREEDDGDDKKG